MKLRLRVCGILPVLAAFWALSLSSCGGGGGNAEPKLSTMGMLGQPSTTMISDNLIFVSASLDGMDEDPGRFGMLVDSGSPVVLIDPSLFGGTPPATTADIPTKVNLGLLDASGQPVVVIDDAPVLQVSTAMMDALGLGGVLGGQVMRQFSVQLDYAAPMMEGFCLGCTAGPRDDVQSPGGVVPFTLKGGGNSTVTLGTDVESPKVDIPATRIPVTVAIDGTNHLCIVDTGATVVSLRSTVYASLVSDGRAQLTSGITIMTVGGVSNASVTRAKTISVGGATVDDAPVLTIMSATPDDLLSSISHELGSQVDCLLGGSFLRNFLVTIDYPAGQLHLEPYNTPPIPDEFRRVGFTLGLDITGNFVVESVYPNSDAAAKKVMTNDEVVAVDGTSLASVGDVSAADALLDGMLGTSKEITFGANTGDPSLAGQTVSINVDDLIPDP